MRKIKSEVLKVWNCHRFEGPRFSKCRNVIKIESQRCWKWRTVRKIQIRGAQSVTLSAIWGSKMLKMWNCHKNESHMCSKCRTDINIEGHRCSKWRTVRKKMKVRGAQSVELSAIWRSEVLKVENCQRFDGPRFSKSKTVSDLRVRGAQSQELSAIWGSEMLKVWNCPRFGRAEVLKIKNCQRC